MDHSASNAGKTEQEQKDLQGTGHSRKRPRSNTMLKMQWLAERVRKIEAIRKAVEDGTYRVDSRDVARSIVDGRFPLRDSN